MLTGKQKNNNHEYKAVCLDGTSAAEAGDLLYTALYI